MTHTKDQQRPSPPPDTPGAAGRRRSRGGTGRVQLGRSLPPLRRPAAAASGCGGRGHGEDRDDRRRDGADQRKGFTLYSFAPDTPTKSKCNGTCAQNWPPVTGPATAAGVKGTFGTIKRADGSIQATFDGHPLYTFVGDTAPGQTKGNGLNAAGGLWHEITTSGSAPPAVPRPAPAAEATEPAGRHAVPRQTD